MSHSVQSFCRLVGGSKPRRKGEEGSNSERKIVFFKLNCLDTLLPYTVVLPCKQLSVLVSVKE